jgi:hypothetical protein
LFEARLAGQSSLLDEDCPELVAIADQTLEHYQFVDRFKNDKSLRQANQDILAGQNHTR